MNDPHIHVHAVQQSPFTKVERRNVMKLAYHVATERHRPKLRESWIQPVCVLISSCWADEPSLRPAFGQIMSTLDMIMARQEDGCIKNAPSNTMPMRTEIKESTNKVDGLHLAPGELWRKVETQKINIKFGEVLGKGS